MDDDVIFRPASFIKLFNAMCKPPRATRRDRPCHTRQYRQADALGARTSEVYGVVRLPGAARQSHHTIHLRSASERCLLTSIECLWQPTLQPTQECREACTSH